jgi:hypothetical protein
MKRFSWRLQRVLEITAQRERLLRAEVLALAHEIARVRHEIAARRKTVQTILDDLGRKALADRLGEQTIVLACAAAEERILAGLQGRREALESERKLKTEQFMKQRTLRRSLERLRETAYDKYRQAMAAREQAEFDEVSHIAFARRLGGTRRGWHDSDRTGVRAGAAACFTAAAR